MSSLLRGGALLLAACAAAGGATNDTTPSGDEAVALLVRNHSGEPICFVHVWPSHLVQRDAAGGLGHLGPDRLGPAEIIGPGEGRAFELDAGDYALRLRDCDEETLMERERVPLGHGAVLTFREREDAAR